MRGVLVLIPAFNEESTVALTVSGVKKLEGVEKVVVVNDGSRDKTAQVAQEAGAEVVNFSKNLGKGKALRLALDQFNWRLYRAVVFIDADVGETSKEAKKLIDPVLKGKADMVIGLLPKPSQKGGFGLVKKLARWGISKLTGFQSQAPLSGQRACSAKLLQQVALEGGFGLEVALTIDALRQGFRVFEVPIQMSHSVTSRNLAGFLHRGKQFADVLKVLIPRLISRRSSV